MNVTDELREFLDKHLPPFREVWGERPSYEGRLEWQGILQRGRWVAPQWSKENGGRGLDVVEALACSEVLADYQAPATAGIFGVANVGPTIAQWGTDEQKQSLIPILEGTELWCQGFSEPSTGSDLAGLRTRAVLDGDEFVINGQKIWTSDAHRAHQIQLLVRTDPEAPKHKGISALLVPLETPGIEIRPIQQINGDAEFCEVFFTDVRVPRSALLGPMNQGWMVTMTTLGHERSGVVTHASAVVREIESMVDSFSFAKAGHELSPHLQDELIERYVEGRVVGILGERSLESIKATGQPGSEQSIIKLEWSLFTQRLSSTRLALGGADAVIGADEQSNTSYLQARSATIAGGTTEVMKNILAQRVLGLPA